MSADSTSICNGGRQQERRCFRRDPELDRARNGSAGGRERLCRPMGQFEDGRSDGRSERDRLRHRRVVRRGHIIRNGHIIRRGRHIRFGRHVREAERRNGGCTGGIGDLRRGRRKTHRPGRDPQRRGIPVGGNRRSVPDKTGEHNLIAIGSRAGEIEHVVVGKSLAIQIERIRNARSRFREPGVGVRKPRSRKRESRQGTRRRQA